MPTEPNVTLPVVLAGFALVLTGVWRLVGRGLPSMPSAVAAIAVVAGIGVAALGFALPRLAPSEKPVEVPLEPASDAPPAVPHGDVMSGRIDGRVQTASGDPVPGADVVLHRYERTDEAETTSAVTGSDGTFSFDDLTTSGTTAYRVTTSYDDATFSTDLLFLGPHAPAERVDLTVAPPTSSDDDVVVAVDSTVFAGDRTGVQVLHILRVDNTDDRAFAGGLRLPVLQDAAGFVPVRGLDRTRIAFSRGDLVSLAPLPPGETEIVYTYGVPLPADGFESGRRLRYPTRRLSVLTTENLVVAGDLREAGTVELGEGSVAPARSYRNFERLDLDAGDAVRTTVRLDEGDPVLRTVLLVAGIVLALVIVAFPLLRRRVPDRAGPATEDRDPTPAVAGEER